ncbi:MAG TPA: undecaprenyl-phosphate glucose phosphotransferase [Bacteroidota bacterium]|nr:undecaprenyl-phosphate glucose phosphotransferase [Bacteroidota bacterium]
MTTSRRGDFVIPLISVAADALAIEGAFLLAYWLRFRSGLIGAGPAPRIDGYLVGSVVIVVVWLLLLQARRMYGARRSVSLADEVVNVVKVASTGMLVVMSAAFFYRDFSYSRVVFAMLWVFSTVFLVSGRGVVQGIERALYRKGRHLQEAILLGCDERADRVYARLQGHPSFGFSILGYFADAPAPGALPLAAAPRLGRLADAPAFIRARGTELAFIALRTEDHPALFDLIAECEGVNVEFMMVPDVLEILTSRVQVRELEGIPFLLVKTMPLTAWGRILKRAFDVAVAALTLLVLSPVMALIAAAVRCESRGPVFFMQRRVGLDGREFTMVKFRSMRAGSELFDADAGLGVRNDPRRTRVGAFLRRTSLDELPQLFNVLAGDMSLVGPRPERTHFVEEFRRVVPKYLDRHRVKTGVTGWAQVNGLRGDTSIEERIKFDLYYIENWSLAFDVRILLRTLRAAFTSRENVEA